MNDLGAILVEVAESLDQGIAIFDPEGHPLYCNPAYRAVAADVRSACPVGDREVGPNRWVRVERRQTPAGLTVVTTVRIPSPRYTRYISPLARHSHDTRAMVC